jgi:hypothetical protein
MSKEEASATRKQAGGQPKVRRFYHIYGFSTVAFVTGKELENKQELRQPGTIMFARQWKKPGFPPNFPTPRFRFDKAAMRGMHDLDQFRGYWLISDRMKEVLEQIDPTACAFVRCNVVQFDRSPGPARWLCDVVRTVDALDEAASAIEIARGNPKVYHGALTSERLVFKGEIVGSAHIFRMDYADTHIICDDTLRRACKSAGLKGIKFKDAIDKNAKTPEKWLDYHRRLARKISPEANPDMWLGCQNVFVWQLLTFAARHGSMAALEEAVVVCRAAIAEHRRHLSQSPSKLVRTYNFLTRALLKLCEASNQTAHLEEIILVNKELKKYTAKHKDYLSATSWHLLDDEPDGANRRLSRAKTLLLQRKIGSPLAAIRSLMQRIVR